MYKYLKSLVMLAPLALLAACSESASDAAAKVVEKEELQIVASYDELPSCTSENEGVQAFVKAERAKRVCVGEQWLVIGGSAADTLYESVKCYTELLVDSSGVKIICGADSVGVVLNGLRGEQGLQGDQGNAGKDGAEGDKGETGEKGDKGPTGNTGANGANGINGSDGADGKDGRYCYMDTYDYTGYNVYCQDDYGWSYKGFIYNGVDGEDGEDGADGARGRDGTLCYLYTIYDEYDVTRGVAVECDGVKVGEILNGKKGESGSNGKDGTSCIMKPLEDGSGSVILCDGDSVGVILNGKDGKNGNDGHDGTACTMETLGDGLGNKIMCKGDSVGFIADGTDGTNGRNGENGTACIMESLENGSGSKIMCNGDSVGVITNGKDGTNGRNGINGTTCWMEALEDGSGNKIVCDGDSIGVILNGLDGTNGKDGKDGTTCWMEKMKDGSGNKILCDGDSVGVILNGTDGSDGKNGVDGTTCWMEVLEDGSGNKIFCDGDSVGVILNGTNGKNGTDGEVCTMSALEDKTGFKITCDGDSVGVVKNGTDGTTCTRKILSNKIGYDLQCNGVSVGEWYDELGLCSTLRDSTIATQNGTYYLCANESWVAAKVEEYDHYGQSCTKSDSGTVVRGVVRDTAYYFCTGSKWRTATIFERNTYKLPCNENGELIAGQVNKDSIYVCETSGFRLATQIEKNLGLGCVSYTQTVQRDSVLSAFAYGVYDCTKDGSSYVWKLTSYEYPDTATYDTIIDGRDGRSYKIVTIGSQTWMAENLNFSDSTIYSSLKGGRSFCYQGFETNCDKYGRLYNWAAAIDSVKLYDNGNGIVCGYDKSCSVPAKVQGVCPDGWRLPTYDDFTILYSAVGRLPAHVQARGFSKWTNAVDAYGFTVLPGGYYDGTNFANIEAHAGFWTSTQYNSYHSYHMYVNNSTSSITYTNKNGAISIRCIKDED